MTTSNGSRPGHRRDVVPGSVWRSRDPRDNGRLVTVESVDAGVQQFGNGYVHVRSVRRSSMRFRTLLDRYDVVSVPDKDGAA
jgi:hypothetical protein